MARKSTRNAQGGGTIRQRPDGRWEARFTYTDELGQKKRASVYADTQKECRQKLTAALKSVDEGSYIKTQRYTVSQWLEEWLSTYCKDLKPATVSGYRSKIETRIKPYIGNSTLSALTNVQIQKFYNKLQAGDKERGPLSPKSIQSIHGILHKALDQAVSARVIHSNPADHIKLPKIKRPDLAPIMDDNVSRFLEAIKGDRFERVFIVDLFSGLRQSEIIGLRWSDVDLETGLLTIRHQIQKSYSDSGYVFLDETKNGKQRIVAIAPSIVRVLKAQRVQQMEWKLAAGPAWSNPFDLVFTDERGEHLKHRTIINHFKKIVASIGLENTRFHDLRHSYAVNALQAGDSVKAVQEQLGHYSSAFTMDVYAAVSDTMRKDSQKRMEGLFKAVSDL